MIAILQDGVAGTINPALQEDPRLSQSQVEAAVKAAKADPTAKVVGLDQKLRPVVACRIHGRRTRFAVMRNGAPTTPGRIVEEWR
jgi:hypothetical protein